MKSRRADKKRDQIELARLDRRHDQLRRLKARGNYPTSDLNPSWFLDPLSLIGVRVL